METSMINTLSLWWRMAVLLAVCPIWSSKYLQNVLKHSGRITYHIRVSVRHRSTSVWTPSLDITWSTNFVGGAESQMTQCQFETGLVLTSWLSLPPSFKTRPGFVQRRPLFEEVRYCYAIVKVKSYCWFVFQDPFLQCPTCTYFTLIIHTLELSPSSNSMSFM